jgi:hypothetical protein
MTGCRDYPITEEAYEQFIENVSWKSLITLQISHKK